MPNAARQSDGIPSIREAAASALAANRGDVKKATDALTERALSEESFLRTNLADAVRTACYNAVAGCIRADRRVVWATPQPTTQERAAQVRALAAGTVASLYDFPLPGGKPLRDATRADVAQAAQFYGDQARDMAWKSRWLGLVAQSLPEGKKVSEVLTQERLEELRHEISATGGVNA